MFCFVLAIVLFSLFIYFPKCENQEFGLGLVKLKWPIDIHIEMSK